MKACLTFGAPFLSPETKPPKGMKKDDKKPVVVHVQGPGEKSKPDNTGSRQADMGYGLYKVDLTQEFRIRIEGMNLQQVQARVLV
jgi:hypothetical protein